MVALVETVSDVRARVAAARARGQRVVLVPTMGNLHAGHAALLGRARAVGDHVVASIYVNPFQFGASEDFSAYPRTLDTDLRLLDASGCDLVFAPRTADIYPHGPDRVTRIEVPSIGDILCGASRPGFFRGVATVVHILFAMVRPDAAVFGDKDYQQLLVIRRMVADLHMTIDIVGEPTVRDADGLATSSRNAYLSPEERARAPALYRALVEARDGLLAGERDRAAIRARGALALSEAGFEPDYFEVRAAADLEIPGEDEPNLRVLAAARLGRARLIDNVAVKIPPAAA